jgi:hypothetical protein
VKILFGVVRNKISSKNDWQFNGHNDKDKQTNNDLQSTKAKFTINVENEYVGKALMKYD